MRHLFYSLLRKLNDGVPSRSEVLWAVKKLGEHGVSSGIYSGMQLYLLLDMEEAADELDITRERLRQYLMKGCRVARQQSRKSKNKELV